MTTDPWLHAFRGIVSLCERISRETGVERYELESVVLSYACARDKVRALNQVSTERLEATVRVCQGIRHTNVREMMASMRREAERVLGSAWFDPIWVED